MFERVLIANRGEVAVRVIRTLRRFGIESVAVFSEADADAPHVRAADRAVGIGPPPAAESYLDVDRVIDAAVTTGAQAIHPGYGFLSESPRLAAACNAHGIVFIGPPVGAIEAMADKIAARRLVTAASVPVVPGCDDLGMDDAAVAAAAHQIGFPVLIKPSAGGGGKGMRLVTDAADLADEIAAARREAAGAFGDDTLFVERFVTNPRHIEIQLLADTHGNVVHFGERECSLQRRHQKVIEEAPSPFIDDATRARLGAQAVEVARSCGYAGAGTVEFIMSNDRPDEFYFMEMNTRLQVEHPVTELVYGVDLVEWQLRVAAGEALPFDQESITPHGHAIEGRVYAEDAWRGFVPTGGLVHRLVTPVGEGVRVDSGIATGSVVWSFYDPMLAKVIAHGATRAEALRRLDDALAKTSVVGVTTNVGFLRWLLADDDVRAGHLDTGLIERKMALHGVPDTRLRVSDTSCRALAIAAVLPFLDRDGAADPWRALIGWRHGRRQLIPRQLRERGELHEVAVVQLMPTTWSVELSSGDTVGLFVESVTGGEIVARIDNARFTAFVHHVEHETWVSIAGEDWMFSELDPTEGELRGTTGHHADGSIRSPMPGTVVAINVGVGDSVTAGQAVAIVEAMKMEHQLRAPFDGTVAAVHVAAGQTVALDATVVTIDANTTTNTEEAP